ncbi:hypothetical protein [Amycolatopsis sp. NPDC051903]|uniref:hypothetical protein n=1 Tax=Amycolatopsis sp. NPDC051903 TaxID=3363936 RepID=UPI00378ED132
MTENGWAWRIHSPGPAQTPPLSWEPGTVPEPGPSHLFQERQVRSVAANAKADARESFRYASEHHLHVRTVSSAPAGAPRVLTGLAVDRGTGAVVLHAD